MDVIPVQFERSQLLKTVWKSGTSWVSQQWQLVTVELRAPLRTKLPSLYGTFRNLGYLILGSLKSPLCSKTPISLRPSHLATAPAGALLWVAKTGT